METVLGILCLATIVGFAVFIFAPLLSMQAPQGDGRFQLVDVFSLVVLWTYPLVIVQAINAINRADPLLQDRSGQYVALVLLEVVMTVVWIRLVRTLSQKEVSDALPRFVMIALGVPLGVVATIGFGVSLVATWGAMEVRDPLNVPVTTLAFSLVGGVVSHLAMRWALSRRQPPKNSPTNGDESPLSTSDRSR